MRFVPSILLLGCLALFSTAHAFAPIPFSSSSFSSASAASSSSSSQPALVSSGPAHHAPLKHNNYMEGRPKRIQKAHNGMEIQTVDAVMSGCPSFDFSATVTIGGQSFQLIVDTGSTSIGVASNACGGCGVSPLYAPGSSAAVQTSSAAFYSSYGDNSNWHATGYTDTISIAGSTATSKGASTLFGAITSNTGFFQASNCNGGGTSLSQGIMGFAGPGLGAPASDGSGKTLQQWFAKYQQAAQVSDIFAIQMCAQSGDLWLGGYDNTTFSGGMLHWVNIQPLTVTGGTFAAGQGYYTVNINSIGLTGFTPNSNTAEFNGNNINSIVDSGTTLMLLPSDVYTNLVSLLSSNYNTQFQTMFGVSASTFFTPPPNAQCYSPLAIATITYMNQNLPTLEVVLGGAANGAGPLKVTLNAASSYLQQTTINGNKYFCSGIQSKGSGSTTILGWSFMNQVIVVHDLLNLKLGFAPRTGCTDKTVGAVSVTGGEINVIDAAIQGGSVTNSGAAGGGSDSGGSPSSIFGSISGLSTTTIIIIVVSVVGGLIILLALCWCCQSKSPADAQMQQAIVQQQEFGKIYAEKA